MPRLGINACWKAASLPARSPDGGRFRNAACWLLQERGHEGAERAGDRPAAPPGGNIRAGRCYGPPGIHPGRPRGS
eukprot:scaffold295719_cov49-Prasinocladus_malaysianus.AAC.1